MRNKPTILIFIVLIILSSCRADKVKVLQDEFEYFCNSELVNNKGDKFLDSINNSIEYAGANKQSSEHVFTGNYSIKLTPDSPYGYTITIPNASGDDYFKATVWRKSNTEKGVIVASAGGFYTASNKVVEKLENGWEKILLEFYVPLNISENLRMYVWNNSSDSIYFDNFSISRKEHKEYPNYGIENAFKLYYDDNAKQKIKAKRYEAFQGGLLIVDDEDYMNSLVFADDDYYESEIRLKGDWLDHIQGDKLSFRVKLKTGFAWRGMTNFSIQTPKARNFQHEWVLHKMLLNNDLLTTRFGFTPVYVNGVSKGIYAWEEHFAKQLVESSNRREGPIVRFDESMVWDIVNLANKNDSAYSIPYFETVKITPFKQGSVLKKPLLKSEFSEALSLMHQMQFRKSDVSDIFDIHTLAGFFAYNLLNEAYHGLAWHNIRYYYNPVLCRLEPLTYDGGYLDNIAFNDRKFFGQLNGITEVEHNTHETLHFWPLSDPEFMKSFYDYASLVSSDSFLNNQFEEIDGQLKHDEQLLKKEYPYYNYSNAHILNRANHFNNLLPNLKEALTDSSYFEKARNIKFKPFKPSKIYLDEIIGYQIHVYRSQTANGEPLLEVANFYGDTIKVLSGKMNSDVFDQKYNDPLVVAPISEPYLAEKFEVPNHYDEVIVEIPSVDKSIFIPITPWAAPKALSSRQEVEQTVSFPQTNYYSINNKTIRFSGNININSHIIIPKGYKVEFKAGTHIDITNSATFVSYSPVFFNGTPENPISVVSSDNSAKGFNVIQAKHKSTLNYVRFDGLSNLEFGGWVTPAAVCFYESDVKMYNAEFARNVGVSCDDALNVVRSNFDVDNCRFIEANSDAFDSDFCTGTVTNSLFERPGNDAIDFSGSEIEITGCTITEAGDKGVSGGEGSTLVVKNTSITGSNIGIASKDKSVVTVYDSHVTGNLYGLSAYVKKPEYGAAKIIVNDVSFKDNMFLHLIEEESLLIFNKKNINGTARKVAERFY
ncbi:MAG: right-handed parallel beta-helix repeat-containing protein [Prolixibacteraceae bacterium]|jgi:hypothetical protein|nr:right-handed parallel beta-helix repeat-containing protein [Prolixibacteraceae bacterium]